MRECQRWIRPRREQQVTRLRRVGGEVVERGEHIGIGDRVSVIELASSATHAAGTLLAATAAEASVVLPAPACAETSVTGYSPRAETTAASSSSRITMLLGTSGRRSLTGGTQPTIPGAPPRAVPAVLIPTHHRRPAAVSVNGPGAMAGPVRGNARGASAANGSACAERLDELGLAHRGAALDVELLGTCVEVGL